MFDFKKTIRKNLLESKLSEIYDDLSLIEAEEGERFEVDEDGWKRIESELIFYSKKIPNLGFEKSPKIEKQASMLQDQITDLIGRNLKVLGIASKSKDPVSIYKKYLDPNAIQQIIDKSEILISKSDQRPELGKTDTDSTPEADSPPVAPDGSSVDLEDKLASKYLAQTGMGGVAVKTIRGMTDSNGKPYGADTKSRERQAKRHPPGSVYNYKGADHVIAYYKPNGQAMGFLDNPDNEKNLRKMKNLIAAVAKDLKQGSLKETEYNNILELIDEHMGEILREINENKQ